MSLPNSTPSSSTTAVVTPPSSSSESQSIHTSTAENILPKQPRTTTVPQPQTLDSNSGLIDSGLGNIDVNKTEEAGEPVEPEKPGAEQLGPEKILNAETVTVAGIVDENRITANLSSVPTAGSLPENGGSLKPVTGRECGPGIGKKKKIVKRVVKVVKKVMKKKMVIKRVPKKVLVHESINPGIMVNAEESEVTEISRFANNEIEKSNFVDELNNKPRIDNEANVMPNITENLYFVNNDVIEKTSIVSEVMEIINITNDPDRESELTSSAGISVPKKGETLRLDIGASDQRVPANDQSSINAWCTNTVKSCNDEITCQPESLEVENVNHIAKNVMETDIFVGGLDKKKTRGDDIRKVFEEVGVVLEVRLMGFPDSVKKNRGFAFVRFATAADANNALAKCSNVEICGKQCSVAPVGIIRLDNINRNWERGCVEKLLKKAGIETKLKFTRKKKSSSAFLRFETREDAHIAFNKLRKKDAFGENSMVEVEWAAFRCVEGVGIERSKDHRSKVKPAVSLANRKTMSKPMECTPDWTIKKPPKAKPETIQGTMWRRLVSKGTEQSRSTSDAFAEFYDLPAPIPPPKRPTSSLDGAAPAKKPRRPSRFSSPATPTSSSITTSVHTLTDGEMSAQYIQSLCPSPNRRTLDKLGDTELVDSCCLDRSKTEPKFSFFNDLPAPIPPPKRPTSSLDGAAPAKKPRRPSRFSSPATPTSSSITTSVHTLTDGEMSAHYIQSLCPSPNRRTLDKLGDTELVDSCCLDRSKRPTSSLDGAAPAKKPRRPSRFSSPATPTSSSITTSVHTLTDGEMSAQYIQSLCPSPNRRTLDKLGDTELVDSCCLDRSKAMAKEAMNLPRFRRGFANPKLTNDLDSLKKDNAKLRMEGEKSEKLVCRLKDVVNIFRTRAKSDEEKTKNLKDENATLRAELDKAMAKEAMNLSRFPELTNELDSLKKDNAKLRMEGEKSEKLVFRLKDVVNIFEEKTKNLKDENATLSAELDKVRADCTKQINEARAEGTQEGHRGFPKSRGGLGLIQSVREITKRAFLRSEEFWDILVDGGMFYYSYALDEAEKWALSKGFNEKFEREGPLNKAPDPPFLEFCEEDNRINSLGPEVFAAHILLQVNRERASDTLAN